MYRRMENPFEESMKKKRTHSKSKHATYSIYKYKQENHTEIKGRQFNDILYAIDLPPTTKI